MQGLILIQATQKIARTVKNRIDKNKDNDDTHFCMKTNVFQLKIETIYKKKVQSMPNQKCM